MWSTLAVSLACRQKKQSRGTMARDDLSVEKSQRTGRKRHIPHIDGNFATFVYVPVPSKKFRSHIEAAQATLEHLRGRDQSVSEGRITSPESPSESDTCQRLARRISEEVELVTSPTEKVETLPKGGPVKQLFSLARAEQVSLTEMIPTFGPSVKKRKELLCTPADNMGADLHLSLCRTFMLQYHLIDPFLKKISEKLQSFRAFIVETRGEIDIFSNEDHSCFFAALSVSDVYLSRLMSPLMQAVNEVVRTFGGPPMLEPFRPHVSLAWTAQDIRPALRSLLQTTKELARSAQAQRSPLKGTPLYQKENEENHFWPKAGQALRRKASDAVSQTTRRSPMRPEKRTGDDGLEDYSFSLSSLWLDVSCICISVGSVVTTLQLRGPRAPSESSDDSD